MINSSVKGTLQSAKYDKLWNKVVKTKMRKVGRMV